MLALIAARGLSPDHGILHTGLVPRLPTAVLVTAFTLLSFLSFCLRSDPRNRHAGRIEAKRLQYLGIRSAIPGTDGGVKASAHSSVSA